MSIQGFRAGPRRVVLLFLLIAWALTATGLAVYVTATAGRQERFMLTVMEQHPNGAAIDIPTFLPGRVAFSIGVLLLLGLAVVGLAWAVAFTGQRFGKGSTFTVVGLFGLAAVSVWLWPRPRAQHWWQPASGQDMRSVAGVWDHTTRDQQASGLALALAAAAGWLLVLVALSRPRRNADPGMAPAGWYGQGPGLVRYWDGSQWTEHTAVSAGMDPTTGSSVKS